MVNCYLYASDQCSAYEISIIPSLLLITLAILYDCFLNEKPACCKANLTVFTTMPLTLTEVPQVLLGNKTINGFSLLLCLKLCQPDRQ